MPPSVRVCIARPYSLETKPVILPKNAKPDEDGLAGLEEDREERKQKAKDKRASVLVSVCVWGGGVHVGWIHQVEG